jgi:hypothetical protein
LLRPGFQECQILNGKDDWNGLARGREPVLVNLLHSSKRFELITICCSFLRCKTRRDFFFEGDRNYLQQQIVEMLLIFLNCWNS